MLPYVELHARSAFSFLKGAATPERYVAEQALLIERGLGAPAGDLAAPASLLDRGTEHDLLHVT